MGVKESSNAAILYKINTLGASRGAMSEWLNPNAGNSANLKKIPTKENKNCFIFGIKTDRHYILRLFQNSGWVAKSLIFLYSNCPENRRWPTWVETPFSEWPNYQIRRNLENCRLTISKTILFSKFLLLQARKWSCW